MASQTDVTTAKSGQSTEDKRWSLPTRLLHLGLVTTVTAQLGLSLVMAPPDEENISALASATFEAHEVVGMIAVVVVLAHWLWTLSSQVDGGLKHLFPWRGDARSEVVAETKALLNGQLPEGGARGGLPGFIHGLGFLAVTGMAITGGTLFFILPESGAFPPVVDLFAESHEMIASLVWLYWGGHGAVALMHHLQGHPVLKDMFRLTNKK